MIWEFVNLPAGRQVHKFPSEHHRHRLPLSPAIQHQCWCRKFEGIQHGEYGAQEFAVGGYAGEIDIGR